MLFNFGVLSEKTLEDLRVIAKAVGVAGITKYRKKELIEAIIEQTQENDQNNEEELDVPEEDELEEPVHEEIIVSGILDLHPDGYGFLRSNHFDSGDDDIYVSPVQVRRFRLKTGDDIVGLTREKRETEKFGPLIYVRTVNGDTPDTARNRKQFEDLTPIYPIEKIRLEAGGQNLTNRIIDLVAPIGKGQRGIIVSPPKAGKTTMLKGVANAIVKNYPEVYVIVLLIDERPEEVTDMERSVVGERVEVVASTFDELPQNHVRVSEIVLERAKRLVEHGKDVVLLLDSITRLTRAYNITSPSSGRTLSGGLDPMALHKPKRFFGAARKIEDGGSMTILATALIDTGSRMDDVIFEEFKGTGNMEVHLDRKLSELRIFPAVDIYKSGTRREELLQSSDEIETMIRLRRALTGSNSYDTADFFFKTLLTTKNNADFIKVMKETKHI